MSDDFFDIGWEEMALLGSLAETLAEGEEERRRLEQETEGEEPDCCCCEEPDPCEPPEEPLEPPDNPSDEDPYP
jgi:hypothetical protein